MKQIPCFFSSNSSVPPPFSMHRIDLPVIVVDDCDIDLYDSVDKQDGYASFVIENAYRSELESFIAQVKGEGAAEYTFEEDLEILKLIDSIEAGGKK